MNFWTVYQQHLAAAVAKNPSDYALRPDETPEAYAARVAEKMRATVRERSLHAVNVTGSPAFRATAKHFGVPHTYKALAPLAKVDA